jgi:spore maturation protein CgeB
MNILVFFPEENSFMGQWQKHHIFDELRRHNHNIHLFNPLSFGSFDQANNELLKFLKNSPVKFDLFINSLGSHELFPETVTEIGKTGIKTLLICFDNLHAPFMHKASAKYFDLVWLTSNETAWMFKKWGCNTVFMPYAANPYIFSPKYENEIPAVGFIGMPYGTRINKINTLLRSGIKCIVYSKSLLEWDEGRRLKSEYIDLIRSGMNLLRFDIGRKVISGAVRQKLFNSSEIALIDTPDLEKKGSVSFEEMNYLYSNHAVSLGITELRNTYVLRKPVHKLHLRTFEIPMCGGLQLSSFTDELAAYFEEDKEIIFYRSDDEMISKTAFYMKPENKTLREKMKLSARRRAERDHSWIKRFEIVFSLLSV